MVLLGYRGRRSAPRHGQARAAEAAGRRASARPIASPACHRSGTPRWLRWRCRRRAARAAAAAAGARRSTGCVPLQLLDSARRLAACDGPQLRGGGWAFQFGNSYYPDLDDTAVVAWAMHQAREPEQYASSDRRARSTGWSACRADNGGFAAFDADNTHYYLNEIPFADHGALLDPPTSDVTARVVTAAGAASGARRTGRRSSAPSPTCAPSRSRTAPGSAAGAPTTSTAPGRCWWRCEQAGVGAR